MTTLFDIELYQDFEKQGTQRDWDKVFYDPAWDEPDGHSLPKIEQNKVLGEEDETVAPQNKSLFEQSDSKFSESITVKSADTEELTPTPRSSIQREQESGLRLFNHSLKAISLWQPYCSLIALGIKQYETRSWKTNYRGKLLICSTAKLTKKQYQQYWKICSSVELPDWNEINFPCGKAIAVCDLVDCIPITPSLITQQSETEIKSGDWEVGRYAWKLENIQPITEPFAVKGKQGLFNISVDTLPSNPEIAELIKTQETTTPIPSEDYLKSNAGSRGQGSLSNKSLSSDEWYTPPHMSDLVTQVLGQITLDPCADEGKHIRAAQHYTVLDDGLIQEWNGRIFMNPPYSAPSVWIKKLQAEFESGRVTEAIALVPAATDTKWLSPLLKSQPVCFWTGRIKFLDTSYKPKLSARQSHCLVYWGENWERFKEVFDPYGVVYPPASMWVNKNVSTQDTVLPVGTGSTHSEEHSPPVLPVGTGSTHSEEHSPPVLPVGTGSTHSEENSSSVLPVERTGSTHSEENSSSVLPVERTGSTQLEERSPLVLPVERTGSTQLKERSPLVLPVERTGSTQLKERSPLVLPVERTGSTQSEEHSPPVLPVGTGSTQLEENSPSVLPVGTGSTQLEEYSPSVLPVERTGSTQSEQHSSSVLPVERTGSTQLEKNSSPVLPVERTGSTTRRSYGEGTGRIHWRTITKKNGKQYQQPWYDWQLKSGEKTISKSTYIPKRLLSQVQMLEAQKEPIRGILQLLGINL